VDGTRLADLTDHLIPAEMWGGDPVHADRVEVPDDQRRVETMIELS